MYSFSVHTHDVCEISTGFYSQSLTFDFQSVAVDTSQDLLKMVDGVWTHCSILWNMILVRDSRLVFFICAQIIKVEYKNYACHKISLSASCLMLQTFLGFFLYLGLLNFLIYVDIFESSK